MDFSKRIVLAYRIALFVVSLLLMYGLNLWFMAKYPRTPKKETETKEISKAFADLWHAPDASALSNEKEEASIRYGKELIAHTAKYLGPEGSVSPVSNGMNCQNCHLKAGTKPFGNNYGSVASLYPKFRERSGGLESIEKRVNDCIQRSLNGAPLDSLSKEMRAMVSYIQWLGKDVPKGKKAAGSGLIEMAYLDRAADPVKGKQLYAANCSVCHARNGQGQKLASGKEYLYPPLWGDHSFNTGAGLYRISNFAKYVRTNMPQGASYDKPVLTEEEAWDVAAYVISMPRPNKTFAGDWPKVETKPIDHPYGPYKDSFAETQHKYGPFKPILQASKSK